MSWNIFSGFFVSIFDGKDFSFKNLRLCPAASQAAPGVRRTTGKQAIVEVYYVLPAVMLHQK
jgi:hypothetical protein